MRKRDDNKIDALYEATIELVNEIGIAATTVAKIAKRANVSAATMYIYFENKEDMLSKAYVTSKMKLSTFLFSGVDPSISVQERFELMLRRFVAFIEQYKEQFLFMEQISNSPLLEKWCLDEVSAFYDPISSLFTEGREQQLFKEEDLQLLVLYSVVPIVHWVKEQLKVQTTIDDQQLNKVIRMSWEAVRA